MSTNAKPPDQAMNGATYSVRLRDLEQRVDELKDQIRRSHTRLALLSDTIVGGGAAGSRAEVEFENEMSSAFRAHARPLRHRRAGPVQPAGRHAARSPTRRTSRSTTGRCRPGDHTIQVALTFQGNGYGVFSYLRGLQVRGEVEPLLHRGRGQDAHASRPRRFEKGGVTTPLEQRPDDRVAREDRSRSAAPAAAPRPPAPARRRPAARVRQRRSGEEEVKLRRASASSACIGARVGRRSRGASRRTRARSDADARAAQTELASVGARGRPASRRRSSRRRASGRPPEQRLAERRAPLPDEGLRPRDRRPQRDPRGVPEHAELPRRALAPRRDVLRRSTTTSRRAATTAQLVEHGSEPRFQTVLRQGARAPGRRVPAPRTIRRRRSTPIFEKFNQVPPAQVDAALLYAKGKALLPPRATTTTRSAAFSAGRRTATDYAHQARYFQGLVAMKAGARRRRRVRHSADQTPVARANYKPAIEAFRSVTELPPDTPEHRHVIDLAWMAIGRLFYEMEQYQQAARGLLEGRARQPRVRHDALRARVGVRPPRATSQRAERALEVLASPIRTASTSATARSCAPTCSCAPARSTARCSSTRASATQYEPMRAKVESFLDSTKDVSVYYDKLAQQQLDLLDQNDAAPAARGPLGARGRGRAARVRRHRRRQRVQDAASGSRTSSSTSSRRS